MLRTDHQLLFCPILPLMSTRWFMQWQTSLISLRNALRGRDDSSSKILALKWWTSIAWSKGDTVQLPWEINFLFPPHWPLPLHTLYTLQEYSVTLWLVPCSTLYKPHDWSPWSLVSLVLIPSVHPLTKLRLYGDRNVSVPGFLAPSSINVKMCWVVLPKTDFRQKILVI